MILEVISVLLTLLCDFSLRKALNSTFRRERCQRIRSTIEKGLKTARVRLGPRGQRLHRLATSQLRWREKLLMAVCMRHSGNSEAFIHPILR
jgi:hypothetical protein